MRAIRIDRWGGPEVLELVTDAPMPEPAEHELLVRVSHAGVNFADTHARDNSYLAPYELPLTPGGEVVGTTEDGRRVAAMLATGGYAEYAAVPKVVAFPVPDGVSDAAALALLVQGLTAWHLYRTSAHLAEGESVVVHAAAGGVGSLAVQLGRAFGAGRVIATASTEEKRALALELGADVAVDVTREDLTEALVEANEGRRVDIVLEMAGGRVFDASLRALAPFGRLVTYGMASREEPTRVAPGNLMRHSSGVIGFWLAHCFARPREQLSEPLQDLFERVASGSLRVVEGEVYPLSEARRAHEDLQARRTTGKLLLDPAS
ncbi:MAG TPA: zinc-binding dehydrogenase [Solirubrobacteraceae bacterium]|nr:zinc-binding dehydrogenase [Solirubrobacteraceae bacterium]